jgi:hypothetical protein
MSGNFEIGSSVNAVILLNWFMVSLPVWFKRLSTSASITNDAKRDRQKRRSISRLSDARRRHMHRGWFEQDFGTSCYVAADKLYLHWSWLCNDSGRRYGIVIGDRSIVCSALTSMRCSLSSAKYDEAALAQFAHVGEGHGRADGNFSVHSIACAPARGARRRCRPAC